MIAELLQTLMIVIGLGASANTNAQTPSFNNRQKYSLREQTTENVNVYFGTAEWTNDLTTDLVDPLGYNRTTLISRKRELKVQTNSFIATAWEYEQDYLQYYTSSDITRPYYLIDNQNVERTEQNTIRMTIIKMFSYGVANNSTFSYYLGNLADIYETNQTTPQNLSNNNTIGVFMESNDIKLEQLINNPQWTQDGFIQRELDRYNNNYYEKIPNTGATDSSIGQTTRKTNNITITPNANTYLLLFEQIKVDDSNNSGNPRILNVQNTQMSAPKPIYSGTNMNIETSIVVGSTTQEVVDIPGLIFNVLIMPFSFYSTAFNLTLFPGTPYAVNISNLVLSLLGVLIFIFIVNKIVKR